MSQKNNDNDDDTTETTIDLNNVFDTPEETKLLESLRLEHRMSSSDYALWERLPISAIDKLDLLNRIYGIVVNHDVVSDDEFEDTVIVHTQTPNTPQTTYRSLQPE